METKMKKKIFVGNLSWKVTEEQLRPLFEAYGVVVSAKVIVDQYTGKSKGFGFVEMESDDAADKAIRELNDKPLLDRNMRVSLAQERSERPASSNREYRGNSGGASAGYGNRGGGDSQKSYRPRQERNFR